MLRPEKMVATVARRRGNEKMVLWVHLLRAAAALAVMIAHAHQSALEIGIGDYVPDFPIGAAGVDLFFVISGFVMVVASADLFGQRGAPPYFFLRRLGPDRAALLAHHWDFCVHSFRGQASQLIVFVCVRSGDVTAFYSA
jgi:hypothetical protein